MSSILRQDFQLLRSTSEQYFFNIPNSTAKINDIRDGKTSSKGVERERLGFYLYALECITNVTETDEILDMMNDGTFLKTCFNETNDDLGVDAVYLDQENETINLFNFKYTSNFGNNQTLPYTDINNSSRFIDYMDKDLSTLDKNKRSYKFLNEINKIREGNSFWPIKLYYVSNTSYSQNIMDNVELVNLEDRHELKIEKCCLDYFLSFIKPRPSKISSSLVTYKNSLLVYKESSYSSKQSYIIDLKMGELLRLTSNSEAFRNNNDLHDYAELLSLDLDDSVLYDNIRGFLDNKGKYNNAILKTIDSSPQNFFYFNNGITMIADSVQSEELPGDRVKLDIHGFQIVNGGQTIKSLDKFVSTIRSKQTTENIEIFNDRLNNVHILLKIFNTGDDTQLSTSISEYTNSQNSISAIDLKANDPIQVSIEVFLKDKDIYYVRKNGVIPEKRFPHRISMEFMGQLLYAKLGYPHLASNSKQVIFDSKRNIYDAIFKRPDFNLIETLELFNILNRIKEIYSSLDYTTYNQKIFYIIYMLNTEKDIKKNIEILEKQLVIFPSDVSDSRTLSLASFKEVIDHTLRKKS